MAVIRGNRANYRGKIFHPKLSNGRQAVSSSIPSLFGTVDTGLACIIISFLGTGGHAVHRCVPRCAPHESDVGYLMAADAGQIRSRGGMHIDHTELSFTIAGYRRHIVGLGGTDGEVIALRFEVSE
jgi:hypothetical protein